MRRSPRATLTGDFFAAFVGALYRNELWTFTSRLENRHSDAEDRRIVSGGFYREPIAGHAFSMTAHWFAQVTLITARGPFKVDDEKALLAEHAVEVIVTKNSGGAGASAKLEAARALGLPVIMVERPALPEAPSVETLEEALAWLDQLHGSTSSA